MFFLPRNNQNQNQKTKQASNRVNGNDILKYNYWPYLCLTFLNPDVYMLNTEWYLDLYMSYLILNARTLKTFLKMCVFSMG